MMSEQAVATFSVHYQQCLAPDGTPTRDLPPCALERETVAQLYRHLLHTRLFDAKAIALQRTGRLGTYPSCAGQEAIAVAIGHCLDDNDVFFPYYRECGAQLMRGVTMEEILLFWGGDERGSAFKASHDFPCCIPIASQTVHAVGAALAMKLKQQARVALTVVGDGGTSEGDFYEAINAAGVWQLPVVFVINNNQWAISVPLAAQTATQTIAQKGIAAGLPCQQVDGNDIFALIAALDAAIARARAGQGATLIEAITYRLGDHTTADDATRYREQHAVAKAQTLEPLTRTSKYLQKTFHWQDKDEKTLRDTLNNTIDAAVKRYLNTAKQPVSSLFDYLYADMPNVIAQQCCEVMQADEAGHD